MTYRTLIPSYSESNHIDTLRYDLCEIIYNDYKGPTFFLNDMLKQKKDVLKKIKSFVKKYPEIVENKGNSEYWYPYPNVDGNQDLKFHSSFYPDTNDEITYFCKGENEISKSDYLFDPVKLHFFLMCQDIKKMNCESDTAKEIVKINNALFMVLLQTVGDTVSYNGLTTLEHIHKYIQDGKEAKIACEKNPDYGVDLKQMIVRDYDSFNDYIFLIDEPIAFCRDYVLRNELAVHQEPKKSKKKI